MTNTKRPTKVRPTKVRPTKVIRRLKLKTGMKQKVTTKRLRDVKKVVPVKKVKITINGKVIRAEVGSNLLDICKQNKIDIPHLCYYKKIAPQGRCRLCMVEIQGGRGPVTSCTTIVREGMVVKTHTPEIIESRRINLELILANHNLNCPTCTANLRCKLQKYSKDLGLKELEYEGYCKSGPVDNASTSIVRDNSKCILCGRCVAVCNEQQTVNAIGFQKRGYKTIVAPPLNQGMKESNCVNCGQCVIACPVGALSEKTSLKETIAALNDKTKHVIVQTAPSIRAALGECFDLPPGTDVTGKMITALKELGFDKVFDTNLGADITIMEEATEFIKRFTTNKALPMITTCCPAWIKFGEQFFPEEMKHMSTCKSPQSMMGSLIKTYYANKIGIKKEDIVLIDIMPCTAKKFEIARPELMGETDIVITTVELGNLINLFNIDFKNLKNSEFDNALGIASGAGDIFGRTGGVMEAALRTAADLVTGKNLKNVEYQDVRGLSKIKEAEVTLNGKKIKIAVAHTLGAARTLMDQIKAKKSPYHFIEIMACYGGCIGGGGQPRYEDDEILHKRASVLEKQDSGKKIRKSHKNPLVQKIYKEFIGEPGGEKAHKLLHTKYTKRQFI